MEQNYLEKHLSIFNNSNTGLNKEIKISKKQIIESSKKIELFHTDCKFTRKKICHCSQFKSNNNQIESNFANFLDDLVKDKIEICTNSFNKKIEFKKKHDQALTKREIELERMKNLNFSEVKNYLKDHDENILSLNDYREIERNINEDKKICENCKTNIYENFYHRGWKNENGEYVLLCPICSKKYFNGALEIKFENKRNEELNSFNQNAGNNKHSLNSIVRNSNNNLNFLDQVDMHSTSKDYLAIFYY